MISTLTDTRPSQNLHPEPSANSPPLMLMEVPRLGRGALLERGLRTPTRKHDLFPCKRQDFKINPARGSCPSSPHALLREEATGSRTGEGQYRVWGSLAGRASPLGRLLSDPTARAPLCRSHRKYLFTPSFLIPLEPAQPWWLKHIRTAKLQPRCGKSPAGSFQQTGEGGTVIAPTSHPGRQRAESAKQLAQVLPLGDGHAGI